MWDRVNGMEWYGLVYNNNKSDKISVDVHPKFWQVLHGDATHYFLVLEILFLLTRKVQFVEFMVTTNSINPFINNKQSMIILTAERYVEASVKMYRNKYILIKES